jgi:hypothetical protein
MKRINEVKQVRDELVKRAVILISELDASIKKASDPHVVLDTISVSLKVTDVHAILNEIMQLREA